MKRTCLIQIYFHSMTFIMRTWAQNNVENGHINLWICVQSLSPVIIYLKDSLLGRPFSKETDWQLFFFKYTEKKKKKAASEVRKKKNQSIKRCHTLRDRTNEVGNEWTCILKHQSAQLEHNGLREEMSHSSGRLWLAHRCFWHKYQKLLVSNSL